MKPFQNKYFLNSIILLSLTACGNLSNEVESKLNELTSKTDSLDALVNKEIDKVKKLDTLINKESEKVEKIDTLINKSSSLLDSISKRGGKFIEKITN
jgi:septal ring factor EnvC (AmiA/AmiB activator)